MSVSVVLQLLPRPCSHQQDTQSISSTQSTQAFLPPHQIPTWHTRTGQRDDAAAGRCAVVAAWVSLLRGAVVTGAAAVADRRPSPPSSRCSCCSQRSQVNKSHACVLARNHSIDRFQLLIRLAFTQTHAGARVASAGAAVRRRAAFLSLPPPSAPLRSSSRAVAARAASTTSSSSTAVAPPSGKSEGKAPKEVFDIPHFDATPATPADLRCIEERQLLHQASNSGVDG